MGEVLKYSAVTLAYNDESIISGTIKCLKPFVDTHYVLISEKPYFGDSEQPDRTEDICLDLGCEVVKGSWSLDHFQRNAGQIMCDSDWIFTFDSDEMMTGSVIEELIRFTEKTKFDAIVNQPEVYWYDTDHVLSPRPSYMPVIMTKPKVRFTHIRNIDREFDVFPWTMHHLSWCYPKDIKKKVQCYAHATDFNGLEWYKKHYRPDEAVMPDGSVFYVKYQPLPAELKAYL